MKRKYHNKTMKRSHMALALKGTTKQKSINILPLCKKMVVFLACSSIPVYKHRSEPY